MLRNRAILLLPLLLLTLSTASAAPLLRRTPGSIMLGPLAVWTDGTTTAIFHPMSEVMNSAEFTSMRIAFQLSELSGPCRLRPAVRFSNDGIGWDNAAPIDSQNLAYINTETITFGTAYVDVTAIAGTTFRSYMQLGTQLANASAGATGFCNATMRVEVKER